MLHVGFLETFVKRTSWFGRRKPCAQPNQRSLPFFLHHVKAVAKIGEPHVQHILQPLICKLAIDEKGIVQGVEELRQSPPVAAARHCFDGD